VTRLCEFTPIGCFFTLGFFLKIAQVFFLFWAQFFHGTSFVLIFDKNGWATYWAIISLHDSGHPTLGV
jgi:hypothetical protein